VEETTGMYHPFRVGQTNWLTCHGYNSGGAGGNIATKKVFEKVNYNFPDRNFNILLIGHFHHFCMEHVGLDKVTIVSPCLKAPDEYCLLSLDLASPPGFITMECNDNGMPEQTNFVDVTDVR